MRVEEAAPFAGTCATKPAEATTKRNGGRGGPAGTSDSNPTTSESSLRIGQWEVHPQLNRLSRDDKYVPVEPRVMQVLVYMVERAGQVVAKDELIRHVWQGSFVSDEALTNAVWEIRKALDDDAKHPRYIQTIPKRGYRLIAPVSSADAHEAAESNTTSETSGWVPLHRKKRINKFAFLASMGLVAIFAAGVVGWKTTRLGEHQLSGPSIETLAVLPLENVSGRPDQEYFADGMTEALIVNLSKVDALKVISRTSVMRYKDVKKTLPEIARELHVDAIVEGSVLLVDGRVRITGQLIHASTDELLWSEIYERELGDVLALQSDIARAIVEGVKITLTPGQEERLAEKRAVAPAAYDAYLKGLYHYNNYGMGDGSFRKALAYFQSAVELDPTYGPAHQGIADAYVALSFLGFMSSQEGYPRAKEAVERALELNPDSGDAHSTLSRIHLLYDWDWAAADRESKLAVELDRSSVKAHWARVLYLRAMGRFEEAIAANREIMRLDPLRRTNSRMLGNTYFVARRYEDSIAENRRAIELEEDSPHAHLSLALALAFHGRYEEAVWECEKALKLHPLGKDYDYDAIVSYVFSVSGRPDVCRRTLDAWRDEWEKNPYATARLYLGAGEETTAVIWLEEALARRCSNMPFLNVVPEMDSLRSNERFQQILRTLAFPSCE